MRITNKLTDFLNLSGKLSNSTIILTDTEKIIFTTSKKFKNLYLDEKISNNLKNVLELYKLDYNSIDYINIDMNNIMDLIVNDNVKRYRSQIILPIIHDTVEGLLIFFVNNRNYIPSNLRFAMTTKHFTELYSSEEYLWFIFSLLCIIF